MSKHKVAELECELLDAAVAKAEGYPVRFTQWGMEVDFPHYLDEMGQDGCYSQIWSPSTEWKQGGPIIERQQISIDTFAPPEWIACPRNAEGVALPAYQQLGPTPLVAAMRSYVASMYGDEVELP